MSQAQGREIARYKIECLLRERNYSNDLPQRAPVGRRGERRPQEGRMLVIAFLR